MTYITAITGPVPNKSMTREEFETAADTLFSELPDFQTQANALAVEVDGIRDDAEAKRAATESLYDDTVLVKDAAEDARDLALTYRDTANTYRGQAEAARDSAQAIAAAYGSELGLPSLTGNARKALAVNGDEDGVEWVQFLKPDTLVILTSGTSWVVPDGARLAKLRLSGGCGGGGISASQYYAFGHGAGPGYLEALVSLTPGDTISYSIGSGGAAAAENGGSGSTGGTTTITIGGVAYTATGGSGGGFYPSAAGAVTSGPGAIAASGVESYGLSYSQTPNATYAVCPPNTLGRRGGRGVCADGPATAGDAGMIVLETYK